MVNEREFFFKYLNMFWPCDISKRKNRMGLFVIFCCIKQSGQSYFQLNKNTIKDTFFVHLLHKSSLLFHSECCILFLFPLSQHSMLLFLLRFHLNFSFAKSLHTPLFNIDRTTKHMQKKSIGKSAALSSVVRFRCIVK